MKIRQRFDIAQLQVRFEDWAFWDQIYTYVWQMRHAGFSETSIYRAVHAISAFAPRLIDEHGNGLAVHEKTIAAFLAWRAQRYRYHNGAAMALARLLALLRDAAAVAPPAWSDDPPDLLIADYHVFLQRRCGFAPRSIASYVSFAGPFVHALWHSDAGGLALLTPAEVVSYIERHAPRRSATTAKIMCVRIRSLLGYLRGAAHHRRRLGR